MPLSQLLHDSPEVLRQELELILHAIREGICGLDSEGCITFCNPSLLDLTGYSARELVGADIDKVFFHSPLTSVTRISRPFLVSPEPLRASHCQVWRKDGSSFPCDYWIRPLKQAAGRTTHIVTFQDRTDLSQANETALRKELRYGRILANLPDVARTFDRTRRTTYISPKIETILGFTSEELRNNEDGKLWEKQIHPSDLACVLKSYDELFQAQTAFDEEYRMRTKLGTWVWVHERACTIYTERGVLYADSILIDITSGKKAQLDLQSQAAFLESITNATTEGILVVNQQGEKILQNRTLSKLFRIPEDIWEDKNDAPLLQHVLQSVKDPDTFLAQVNYLYQHPDEVSRDEIEMKSGSTLDRYTAPVIDRTGKYYGRVWTFRDITDRRRYENALKQLSAAVDQSPSSILITDTSGTITYVNRAFTESSGYAPHEVLGKNPNMLKSDKTLPEVYKQMWATLNSGGVWRGELCNRKKSGEMYWVFATIFPVTDDNGTVTQFIGIQEDITSRRVIEEQLRQAQKLEAIGQLAAGIAHEINTPTQFVNDNLTFLQDTWESVHRLVEKYRTVLSGLSDAAVSSTVRSELCKAEAEADLEFVAAETPKAISQALEGAHRISRIVRAMKEFSHPDSSEKALADLNQAIETTITVARNEWKYVAELETHFDPSLPPVSCHIGEVNQVVLNLIVNAAHAIREKVKEGEKGRITISTHTRPEGVEIAITDTGAGIPEAVRSRVFEPFFTTKEVGKGTGQGLALAHNVVVKRHGGKIWFESEVGRGTTFYLHFPIS